MIRYFVHRGGRTETVDRFDSSFAKATEDKPAGAAILRDAFGLHALAVIATLFGPMTVITGLMVLTSTGLFVWFRKSGWW